MVYKHVTFSLWINIFLYGNFPITEANCTGDASNCTPQCEEGYALQNDGVSCYDIDECEEPGKCSQLCENLKGSFSCGCFDGYIQDRSGPRSSSCKAEGKFVSGAGLETLQGGNEIQRVTFLSNIVYKLSFELFCLWFLTRHVFFCPA